VAIISLPYTQDKPYAVISRKEKGHGRRYYIRVGTTSRDATREELRRIYQASAEIYYDTVPVITSSINKSLDLDKIFAFYEQYYNKDISGLDMQELERLFLNVGISAVYLDNKIYPTLAGILLFGKSPEEQLFQAGMVFCAVKGNKIGDSMIDRKVFNSTLKENVDNFCDMMKTIVPNYPEIIGARRIEKEIFPYKVVREAVVNALVHRDYTFNSKVRIFLFNDRLEIKSPGGLPNGVTIERMKDGVSIRRNPTITKFMSIYQYMEYAGRGIPMIFEKMKAISSKEPEIKVENGGVTLILYPRREDNGV
jgi:ATP-dependent DNA helicase RecG